LFCLFVCPEGPLRQGRGVSVFVLSTACCMGVAMHISTPGAAVLRIVHPSLVGPPISALCAYRDFASNYRELCLKQFGTLYPNRTSALKGSEGTKK
jgi:hypothetical protein